MTITPHGMSEMASGAMLLIVVVFGLMAYFLPYILGKLRGVSNPDLLFMVNLWLGWTLLGWLVCLIWAALGQSQDQVDFYRYAAGKARRAGDFDQVERGRPERGSRRALAARREPTP